jgi:hypothetical protein
VLVAPKVAGTSNVVSLKLMGGALTGRRYESSAAAVDSTDPPAEKHEYQAEVLVGCYLLLWFGYKMSWCFRYVLCRSTGSWI